MVIRWNFKQVSLGVVIFVSALLLATSPLVAQTTLEYWIWDNNQLPAVQQIIEAFESEYPNIKVNVSVVGWGEYWEKTVVAILGGSGPDVFWMTMYDVISWIERGLIEDLTARIDSDPIASQHFAEMWPILTEAYTYKGRIWGMPRDFDSIAVVYNTNYVAEAGLPDLSAIDDHWTTDDYVDYARRMTIRSGDQVQRWGAIVSGSIQEGYGNFVRTFGGEFFNEERTAMIVDSAASREAIQYLYELIHVHQVAPLGDLDIFHQNQAAMIPIGNWNLRWTRQLVPQTEVAQLPLASRTGQRSSMVHGLADVINPYSENKDAAFEFIKFLSSYAAHEILGSTGTVIPSRQDASLLYFAADVLPGTSTAYLEAINYGAIYPSTPYLARNQWEPILSSAVQRALNGEVPVEEALSTAQAQINSLISENMKKE